jgi:hypothetical protein
VRESANAFFVALDLNRFVLICKRPRKITSSERELMRLPLMYLLTAVAMLNAVAEDVVGDSTAAVLSQGGHVASDVGDFFATADCNFLPGIPAVTDDGQSGFAQAHAGFGLLAALAHVSVPGRPRWHSTFTMKANASSTFNDVIVEAAPGASQTAVGFAYFDVHGALATAAVEGAIAEASVKVVISAGGVTTEGILLRDRHGLGIAVGFFEDLQLVPDAGFTLALPVILPVGKNSVSMSLAVSAFGDQNGAEISGAVASSFFNNTVSFAKNGPAFELPEGYTVNSVSANIVNNHWIPPAPEPASALLGLIAATGWSALGIRTKRGMSQQTV